METLIQKSKNISFCRIFVEFLVFYCSKEIEPFKNIKRILRKTAKKH